MTTKHWMGLMVGVAVLAAVATGSTVMAQTGTTSVSAKATSPDDWRFTMPVGFYAFSVKGPVGLGDLSREVDLDSGDVSDKIDRAFGVALDFGKGKWSGITSATFLKFEGDWRDVPALPPATGTVEIKPTLKWSTLQGAAAYRAVWIDREPGKAFIFEPVGGLRFTKLEGTLENVAGDERSRDVNWTDLFVGFRMSKAFTPHLGWSFTGDYGYGISGNSKPMWDAATSLGWTFPFDGWAMTAAVGYKAGGVQFEDKEGDTQTPFNMDITMQGPTLGVAFSW